jgi:hypothetical protein
MNSKKLQHDKVIYIIELICKYKEVLIVSAVHDRGSCEHSWPRNNIMIICKPENADMAYTLGKIFLSDLKIS